jgi:hypothetical protein
MPHPRLTRRAGYSRRAFLRLLGAGALAPLQPPAVRYLTEPADRCYFTYPHQNGFYDGGRRVVLGQLEQQAVSLWSYDLRQGRREWLARLPLSLRFSMVYYDISAAGVLAAMADNSVWLLDLRVDRAVLRRLYTPPPGQMLHDLVSLHPDGHSVIAVFYPLAGPTTGPTSVVRVRLSDGAAETLFSKEWFVNHLQHCHADPTTIGCCHEGAFDVPDRLWAFNPRWPQPTRQLWDQRSQLGTIMAVGHERWYFRAQAALVVAYPQSKSAPRGLYKVDVTGGATLIHESDRFWHCNLSRDDRWAVVDTFPGLHGVAGESQVVLVDMAGEVAPRALATARAARHPAHPHPHFTPASDAVIFNDAGTGGWPRVGLVETGLRSLTYLPLVAG